MRPKNDDYYRVFFIFADVGGKAGRAAKETTERTMGEKIAYTLIISLLRALAHLPLRILYGISDVLYFIIYRLWGYRVQVVRGNLRSAFPDRSDEERRQIEKEFYRHLCDCIVETVKLLHISDEELLRRVEVRNSGAVDAMTAGGSPVILFLGHYGNWEWCQVVSMAFDRRAVGGEIYKTLSSNTMERVMRTIRSRFGTMLIPHRSAYRTLMEMSAEHQPFIVGFISDQRPDKSMMSHWTMFLNQKTAYFTGGEKIGQRTGARFVYVDVEKPGRGRYRLTLVPMETDARDKEPYPYTEHYFRLLEQTIVRQPAYWLWSHKRWYFRVP